MFHTVKGADCAAREVSRDERQQFGLDGHAAFLAAFVLDMDYRCTVARGPTSPMSVWQTVCRQPATNDCFDYWFIPTLLQRV